MATNHGSIEFLKFPNPQYPGDNTKLIKKWLRDSWARRKILALQQTIAAIVVPTKTSQLTNDSGFITQADVPPGSTPSSTTPKMDGTASVGTETAFARGDHRHPTDTSRQAALSSAQMAAVNSGITSAKVAAYDAIEVPTKTSELTNDSGFITSYTETDPTVPAWAKASTKPSYTAAEVGALPDDTVIPTVPTKISAFQNDAGYITGFTETDPTVPSWAKASTKPTYTASEVGALPDTTEIPSKTSDLTNDSGFITSSSVPSAYTSNPRMDGTASAGSSTAWARGDHRHPTDTSRQAALSSTQLAAVNSGVTAAKVQAWDSITVPTKTSELTNDSGYITSVPVTSVNGKTGAVSLDASDVGALPSSTSIPSKTSDLTNDSGYITSSDLPSVPSPSTTSPKMNGTASAGSSAAWSRGDHVHPHDTSKADKATTLAGYGITNAYTKTEVDGMIPTVPTNVSAFTNDAGYITSAPVTSVNGQTGAVNLSAADVGAQNALTTTQMDAVNSGITAEKVAEYDGIETMFGRPTSIPSGSDLNNYMTPGHYSANSGTVAASLVNSPSTANFSLFVIYRTGYISQIIIGSSNSIFMRHRTSTAWGGWYKITGTAVST